MTRDIPGDWTYTEDSNGFRLKTKHSWGDTLKLSAVFLICSPFIWMVLLFIWSIFFGQSDDNFSNWIIALLICLFFTTMVTFVIRAALRHLGSRQLRFTSGTLEFRLAYILRRKFPLHDLAGIQFHIVRGKGGIHGSSRFFAYLHLNRKKKRPLKVFLFSCDDLSSEVKPVWDSLIDRLLAKISEE
jgi:hypothetical protein